MSHDSKYVPLNVVLDGSPSTFTSKTKLLGSPFDNFLSWEDHIKCVHQKIAKTNLYPLQWIKDLPLYTRKPFVNNYILPPFDCCCVACGNCSVSLCHNSEKLQKRVAHMILDVKLDKVIIIIIIILGLCYHFSPLWRNPSLDKVNTTIFPVKLDATTR